LHIDFELKSIQFASLINYPINKLRFYCNYNEQIYGHQIPANAGMESIGDYRSRKYLHEHPLYDPNCKHPYYTREYYITVVNYTNIFYILYL
jgi:hypothetical protein